MRDDHLGQIHSSKWCVNTKKLLVVVEGGPNPQLNHRGGCT